MYCPRCSQHQISDDTRFCPGCGLQLSFVTELVLNNGVPFGTYVQAPQRLPLMRRTGVRIGAKFMFASVVIFPVAFLIAVGVAHNPGPLVFPIVIFLIGLTIMLYNLIFGEDQSTDFSSQQSGAKDMWINHRLNLPSVAQQLPRIEQPRTNTAEMLRPPSVTEHTTKLLD